MRQARTYGRVWAPGQTPSALKHGILMFRGPNGSGPAACRAHCTFRVTKKNKLSWFNSKFFHSLLMITFETLQKKLRMRKAVIMEAWTMVKSTSSLLHCQSNNHVMTVCFSIMLGNWKELMCQLGSAKDYNFHPRSFVVLLTLLAVWDIFCLLFISFPYLPSHHFK